MPRLHDPMKIKDHVRGYRLEVLSGKTMEWYVAYSGVGNAWAQDLGVTMFNQAIKDPETLEVRLLRTHEHAVTRACYASISAEDVTNAPALEEPVIVQHVKMHWRRGRTY